MKKKITWDATMLAAPAGAGPAAEVGRHNPRRRGWGPSTVSLFLVSFFFSFCRCWSGIKRIVWSGGGGDSDFIQWTKMAHGVPAIFFFPRVEQRHGVPAIFHFFFPRVEQWHGVPAIFQFFFFPTDRTMAWRP